MLFKLCSLFDLHVTLSSKKKSKVSFLELNQCLLFTQTSTFLDFNGDLKQTTPIQKNDGQRAVEHFRWLKNYLYGNEMQGFASIQSQRGLTAPEELNGGVTSAITIFHITGIIPQVLLLYGANSQGNGHFLLTEVLLDNPARPTKQY